MWYVYIIRSLKEQFLYVGSTNNLERRLDEHNTGMSKSTAPFQPFELLSFIATKTEHQARTLEQYFKTGSGKSILKKRILNDEDLAEHEVRSET